MKDRSVIRSFILQNTRLRRLLYPGGIVPELQLYLADELMSVWRSSQRLDPADTPPPYWAAAWAGGQALARYLLDHPDAVAGRRVLDLAAGSGICGIAASLAGARQVLAADIDPLAVEAVTLNAEANGVMITSTIEDILARNLPADPSAPDLILAGDIWYDRALAQQALPWLQAAHERGIRILVGDPGRAYFPDAGMTLLIDYEVPVSRELEDSDVKRTRVFAFSSRKMTG